MSVDSKVLTVSYGAFSCTLKGFDDPFEVMRAVTEMLEEIAARTPGFGLLPADPDSRPLQEIARVAGAELEQDGEDTYLVPAAVEPVTDDLPDPEPASGLDAKLDRIRSALMDRPVAPSQDLTFPSDEVAPAPMAADPAPAPREPAPKVFPAPMVEDPSEQVLLDAKEELARELAKIEAEIVEERAKQARLKAEAEQAARADEDDLDDDEPEAEAPALDPIDEAPEPMVADHLAGHLEDDRLPEPEAEEDDEPEAAAEEEDRVEAALNAPDPRPALGDTSVTRILEQTNWEMDKPEGNRRRSAIAHLRAAVAATRADRILGQGGNGPGAQAAYREDLEDAVRPHALSGGELAEARTGTDDAVATAAPAPVIDPAPAPAPSRPAPLKLVAAQRVDPMDEDLDDLPPPPAMPIRSRRAMASTTLAEMHARMEEAAPGGFAAYAAAAGAESLDQLMEAAAAYMTFVEHRDQFSRPQLMNKMREAEEHDTPREDRLRIFASLLRDAKIVKVGGGRFIGTDKIGFQP